MDCIYIKVGWQRVRCLETMHSVSVCMAATPCCYTVGSAREVCKSRDGFAQIVPLVLMAAMLTEPNGVAVRYGLDKSC